MRRIGTFAVSLAGLLLMGASQAETVYISDELTVPLRSGPSNEYRIIHAGLPSGTRFEVLAVNEAAGFTNVRTGRGTEGWIRSQYLVREPIASVRLARTEATLADTRAELAQLRARNADLQQSNVSQAEANAAHAAQIEQLQGQLEEIRRVSAGALQTAADNRKLSETNARLQDELDDLGEAVTRLEDNAENQAILIGAGLLFAGLLLGVIIKARPQRSAWN